MTDASSWPVTIVESPFAGDMEANRLYALRACLDCLRRQEVPFASHAFFPQMLNEDPLDRELGLTAGYAVWHAATRIAFYCDRGFSSGMKRALDRATKSGHVIEYRVLDGKFASFPTLEKWVEMQKAMDAPMPPLRGS